ncbi:YbaB/EbfC family nucleoid-associated protein [Desulforamulus hydrothermalis]|uniref:Nucleoid-associated protein n=1 Tax=Desulforamulus hydrothermalis Lam5 = DSM 18033 TaxID=1121428 RepID=K8DZN3_9FIRM|nr:YbaB/EbfC family nucleoid-associated protein [Desulforamulus hydrothermalis]CCO08587.1 conserved hypothetical protein [Desulforamulus hydrothermalis Lam5 = DSM 18033]SHH01635.1 hypothetical protein SAMN02745177_01136 [Desulforamulus hydrothermalis Lam5 = DSM 18033]
MFGNLGGMLSQVQNMQESLKEIQVEITVGDGDVTVLMNGVQNLLKVQIAPRLMQQDVQELEDKVAEAINLAQQASRSKVQEQVAKMTGINLSNFMNMFKV